MDVLFSVLAKYYMFIQWVYIYKTNENIKKAFIKKQRLDPVLQT